MAKTLSTLYSTMQTARSTSRVPRDPCYLVAVDLPAASECVEAIGNFQLVNIGDPVTVTGVVLEMLGIKPLNIQFDGRMPDDSKASLMSCLRECKEHLHEPIQTIFRHASFEVLIYGAEIDEVSESLWIFLDDPENPLSDHH